MTGDSVINAFQISFDSTLLALMSQISIAPHQRILKDALAVQLDLMEPQDFINLILTT